MSKTTHERQEEEEEKALYFHGDVCYGGGSQVKVLLHENVEFGGQVPPSTNTVNLAGEQRRDLEQQESSKVRTDSCDKIRFDVAEPSGFSPTSFLGRSDTSVSSPCG